MKIPEILAKWAYLWNVVFDRRPYQTSWDIMIGVMGYGNRSPFPLKISLCALTWRSLLISPLLVLAGIAGVGLIATGLREIADILLIATVSVTAIGLTLYYVVFPLFNLIPQGWANRHLWDRLERFEGVVAPLVQGVVATKKKVCPIWDVER